MHDGVRWRTFVKFLPALLMMGCDLPDPCQRCKKPEATPPTQTSTTSTVKLEVDWAKLSKALGKIQTGGNNQTVSVESLEVTVPPGGVPNPPPNWGGLIAALNAVAQAGGDTHNVSHTTLNLRFAPPWVNVGSGSLLTTYVVFAEEAKIHDGFAGNYEHCGGGADSLAAAVCPDHAFHKLVLGQFLEGLARCATDEEPVLRTVGFASSSGVGPLEDEDEDRLDAKYQAYMERVAGKCQGTPPDEAPESELDNSAKFNLLVANLRAVHTKAMLEDLAQTSTPNRIRIEHQDWCSHGSMAPLYPDKGPNGYNTARGLVNRRAEIRLAALPGCASG